MEIFGIGVDIVDNIRFKKLVNKKRFINRIFSAKELSMMPPILKGKTNKNFIRKLTPKECERLQGFPDDWTKTG